MCHCCSEGLGLQECGTQQARALSICQHGRSSKLHIIHQSHLELHTPMRNCLFCTSTNLGANLAAHRLLFRHIIGHPSDSSQVLISTHFLRTNKNATELDAKVMCTNRQITACFEACTVYTAYRSTHVAGCIMKVAAEWKNTDTDFNTRDRYFTCLLFNPSRQRPGLNC